MYAVAEVSEVHVVPLSEVKIFAPLPTVTMVLFPYATPLSIFVVPEVLEVHVVPSEEARRVSYTTFFIITHHHERTVPVDYSPE